MMTENTVATNDSHAREREPFPLLQVVMPVTKQFSRPTMQIIDGQLVAVVVSKPA